MKAKNLKLFGFLVCLLSMNTLYAQTGKVEIIKDSRINALIAKQCAIVPPAVKPEIDGYRIQLFFDSDRAMINDAKSRFLSKFSKIDTYVLYNAPNYFLKVGDFRTRLEAERIKAKIEGEFPTSFVVKEKINLPRLEKEELPD